MRTSHAKSKLSARRKRRKDERDERNDERSRSRTNPLFRASNCEGGARETNVFLNFSPNYRARTKTEERER
jgi:hypothetical protein